ncbi:hypothetical protein HK104_002914 [Borealophlyctis nickersoniae]|nr:hypothetical protein HK104_002914 [Borealophlyctis nickersoniae]
MSDKQQEDSRADSNVAWRTNRIPASVSSSRGARGSGGGARGGSGQPRNRGGFGRAGTSGPSTAVPASSGGGPSRQPKGPPANNAGAGTFAQPSPLPTSTTATIGATQQRGRNPQPKSAATTGTATSQRSDSVSSNSSASSAGSRSPSPHNPAAPPAPAPITFWQPQTLFACPFPCDLEAPLSDAIQVLDHLEKVHRIRLAEPRDSLPFLEKYVGFWAKKCAEKGVENVSGVVIENESDENGKPLYLIGKDVLPEDKDYREKLQREKLDEMLKVQDRERHEDSMQARKCLFCKLICDNRTALFKHMFNEHGFNIGLPDNLVEVNAFLDTLQIKLAGLQCLYCEKIFKTSAVLRKHMRKKKHFKINPRNHSYDRFYIINYVEFEPGKNWETYQNDKYESDEDRKDDSWEDWNDESSTSPTMCLFDETIHPSPADAHTHMSEHHNFNLLALRKQLDLDFYATIRLINYIRRQTSLCTCFSCGAKFDSLDDLTRHFEEEAKEGGTRCVTTIPPKSSTDKHQTETETNETSTPGAAASSPTSGSFWTDPQYLFPCYENDPLLTFDPLAASDDEGDDDNSDSEEYKSRRAATIREAQDAFRNMALEDHLKRLREEEAKSGGETEKGGEEKEKRSKREREREEKEEEKAGPGGEQIVAWVGKRSFGIVKGE